MEATYFIHYQNKKYGPVSSHQVIDLYQSNKINPSTFILKVGTKYWVQLKDFRDFKDNFNVNNSLNQVPSFPTESSNTRRVWFYYMNGYRNGPFTSSELIDMIKSKQLRRKTLIFREGMNEWRKISTFAEFSRYFPSLPPHPPSQRDSQGGANPQNLYTNVNLKKPDNDLDIPNFQYSTSDDFYTIPLSFFAVALKIMAFIVGIFGVGGITWGITLHSKIIDFGGYNPMLGKIVIGISLFTGLTGLILFLSLSEVIDLLLHLEAKSGANIEALRKILKLKTNA